MLDALERRVVGTKLTVMLSAGKVMALTRVLAVFACVSEYRQDARVYLTNHVLHTHTHINLALDTEGIVAEDTQKHPQDIPSTADG